VFIPVSFIQASVIIRTAAPLVFGENLSAGILSTGGAPDIANLYEVKGIMEHRAGTVIFDIV
jgi:hypothetical protein